MSERDHDEQDNAESFDEDLDESYRAATGGDDPDDLPLDVQLAEIEDAALDDEVTGGTG